MSSTAIVASPDASAASAPEVTHVRVVHEGWGSFLMVRVRLPDGREIDREVEDHGAAVAVLPYDPDRRLAVLVRQLRPPALLAAGVTSLLEAPAGRLESDDPESCALRECQEETGLRLLALEPVAAAWPMAAVSTERIHLFLAPFSATDRIGPGGGLAHEGEEISVETLPLARLGRMADAGQLPDLKTLLLVMTLRYRRPDLFDREDQD